MKLAALFLAVLGLALSLIPCRDANAAEKQEKTVQVFAQDCNDNDSHTGDCSPLCICGCCSMQSMPSLFFFTGQIPKQISPYSYSAYQERLFEVSLPIWQPPQLIG